MARLGALRFAALPLLSLILPTLVTIIIEPALIAPRLMLPEVAVLTLAVELAPPAVIEPIVKSPDLACKVILPFAVEALVTFNPEAMSQRLIKPEPVTATDMETTLISIVSTPPTDPPAVIVKLEDVRSAAESEPNSSTVVAEFTVIVPLDACTLPTEIEPLPLVVRETRRDATAPSERTKLAIILPVADSVTLPLLLVTVE